MPKKVGQDKKIIRKATCKQCGAKLEYYPKEIKSQALYSMGEYDGTHYWIVCPECNKEVTVRGS